MEINLNRNFAASQSVSIGDTERTTMEASQGARQTSNLEVTKNISGLASAEPAAQVSDAALTRDDALGRLVSSAFSLQPPPMPNFDS